jgi:hypothetical protein
MRNLLVRRRGLTGVARNTGSRRCLRPRRRQVIRLECKDGDTLRVHYSTGPGAHRPRNTPLRAAPSLPRPNPSFALPRASPHAEAFTLPWAGRAAPPPTPCVDESGARVWPAQDAWLATLDLSSHGVDARLVALARSRAPPPPAADGDAAAGEHGDAKAAEAEAPHADADADAQADAHAGAEEASADDYPMAHAMIAAENAFPVEEDLASCAAVLRRYAGPLQAVFLYAIFSAPAAAAAATSAASELDWSKLSGDAFRNLLLDAKAVTERVRGAEVDAAFAAAAAAGGEKGGLSLQARAALQNITICVRPLR